MPHFVYEQTEAREVKELALDGTVDSPAVALIKVCLTREPELLATPLELSYPIVYLWTHYPEDRVGGRKHEWIVCEFAYTRAGYDN